MRAMHPNMGLLGLVVLFAYIDMTDVTLDKTKTNRKSKTLQMKIFSSFVVSFLTIASRKISCTESFARQSSMLSTKNLGLIDQAFIEQVKDVVPKLSQDRHKGQAGRIGVVGGSTEYPGKTYTLINIFIDSLF